MTRYTKLSLALTLLVWVGSFFYYHSWSNNDAMMGGDHFGYYAYLPATFIQHDLKDLKQTIYQRDNTAGHPRDSTSPVTDVGEVYFYNETPVIKYTCGIAILELPPFIIANTLASIFHQSANGFSSIYIILLHLWNLIFAFAGLVALVFVLKEFFGENDWAIALGIFAIAVGTNLYYFVVYKIGLSHPYLFTLYAILILATTRFYKTYGLGSAALIGLSAGMISLIRPNEIICLIIPILYGIPQIADIKERGLVLIKTKGFYLAVALFACCALPQLIYWKSLTGHWLYYSYGSEVFDFKHSKIGNGLFMFKNGWLPYTPVMILALIGILPLFLQRGKTLLPTLIFVPLHIYIIYSWWCWTYTNGLGSRPMIETYPLLSIPLTAFISLASKNKVSRNLLLLAVLFFAAQQIMMTNQSSRNILWSEDSTWTFYRTTFFKSSIDMKDVIAFDTDEKQPLNPTFSHPIFFESYADSVNPNFIKNACGRDAFSFLLNREIRYTPALQKTLTECNLQPLDWVKVTFDNCNLPPCGSLASYASMCVEFKNSIGTYKKVPIRIQNKIQPPQNCGIWVFTFNTSGKVSFFTQVPKEAKPGDALRVYACNFSDSPVAINNLHVDAYKP